MKTILSGAVSSLLLLLTITLSCSPKLDHRVRTYFEAHNSHHVEKIMSLYAEDTKLTIIGAWTKKGKREIRKLEEWEAALNSHLTFTNLKASGDTITFKVTEQDDLLRAAGIDKVRGSCSMIFSSGLIKEIRAELTPKSEEVLEESFDLIVEWVSQKRSHKLDELMPEGKWIFSAETAKGWLALVEEWRKETTLP